MGGAGAASIDEVGVRIGATGSCGAVIAPDVSESIHHNGAQYFFRGAAALGNGVSAALIRAWL
jgi:hypothetical protein